MRLARFIVLTLIACTAAAGEPDADSQSGDVSYRRAPAGSGWQARVDGRRADPRRRPESSTIPVRIYEGFANYGPVYDGYGRDFAVDVIADIDRCADGQLRMRGLYIGGWRYEISSGCRASGGGGHLSVNRGDTSDARRFDTTAPARDRRIRCESDTWSCRSVSAGRESPRSPVTRTP